MSKKGLELINKLAGINDDMIIDFIICNAIEEGIDVDINEIVIEEEIEINISTELFMTI